MIKKLRSLFFGKELNDVLNEYKKVKIKGVIFHIKRINPLDYLNGSKVMIQIFDEYKRTNDVLQVDKNYDKIKNHYIDVILAGVIKPQLSRKENDSNKIYVGEIINNPEMTNDLYTVIMDYSYGKKKIRNFLSPKKESLS